MSLYNHQKRFILKNKDKDLLCWSCGLGKTRASIEWSNLYNGDVLVICPKALKENWYRNLKEFAKNDFNILTKEEFRRDWDKLPNIPQIIGDEFHYFSGQKSQMSKNFRKYIKKHKTPRLLFLTATPYLSTPWNIYTLAGHLGKEWNWWKFKDKFFNDRYIGRRVVPEVKEGIEEEIAKLVASLGDVVKLEDCVDVPEQVYETEYFDLHPDQIKAIKDTMEVNPIVRYTKHHQIENGTLKGDEYVKDTFIKSYKTDRILELAEENDKVIFICRYNLQINLLEEILKPLNKPVLIIRGDVKDRDKVVQEAEKLDKAIVLINAACSEGFELPSYPLMVFASLSFSYKDYKQMTGRILRINKLKKNVYIHLISGDTDKAVYNAIMKKQDFDVEIYAKERGTEEELLGEGFSD